VVTPAVQLDVIKEDPPDNRILAIGTGRLRFIERPLRTSELPDQPEQDCEGSVFATGNWCPRYIHARLIERKLAC
jgi:hypothetical protein